VLFRDTTSWNFPFYVQVKVVLDTPFAVVASAPGSIARPILQAVTFAPYLRDLAAQAAAALRERTGRLHFTGLHLRVEPDAIGMKDWAAGTAAVEVGPLGPLITCILILCVLILCVFSAAQCRAVRVVCVVFPRKKTIFFSFEHHR
jgi:hypothetical protein